MCKRQLRLTAPWWTLLCAATWLRLFSWVIPVRLRLVLLGMPPLSWETMVGMLALRLILKMGRIQWVWGNIPLQVPSGGLTSMDFECKGPRGSYQCPGDTGSTVFSFMHHSLIRGCRPNTLYHPIHACAHSRLDQWGWFWCWGWFGACAGLSYVVSSCVVDDVDDACMDVSVLDGIRVGSNSVIQSFSEYHDSSCARLNALQNSHLERGHQVRGETKPSSTGSLCKVRLSVGKKRSFPQQQARKVHGEMWAGLLKKQGPRISQEVEIIPGCAAMVACPSCHDNYLEPTGPGRWVGHNWRKPFGPVWLFRGALQGESLFSSLVAAGDWVRKGSYHTAWSVPCSSSCTCSYAYGQGTAIKPNTGERCWPLPDGIWRPVAPLMKPWSAEGDQLPRT